MEELIETSWDEKKLYLVTTANSSYYVIRDPTDKHILMMTRTFKFAKAFLNGK